MWLNILTGITQLLPGGLGVWASLRPPKAEHHWRWIGTFISIGLVGGVLNVIAGHNANSAQSNFQRQISNLRSEVRKANAVLETYGPKLEQIIQHPNSEKQKQDAILIKKELSRSQSSKNRVDPKQAIYNRTMELADRIGVIGDDLDNEVNDLLHQSIGPQGFKIRMDEAHTKWIGEYEQRYLQPALLARQQLLEVVPDVPIYGHLGDAEGEYRYPTNAMGIKAVSENLRAIAGKFAQKYSLKTTRR